MGGPLKLFQRELRRASHSAKKAVADVGNSLLVGIVLTAAVAALLVLLVDGQSPLSYPMLYLRKFQTLLFTSLFPLKIVGASIVVVFTIQLAHHHKKWYNTGSLDPRIGLGMGAIGIVFLWLFAAKRRLVQIPFTDVRLIRHILLGWVNWQVGLLGLLLLLAAAKFVSDQS